MMTWNKNGRIQSPIFEMFVNVDWNPAIKSAIEVGLFTAEMEKNSNILLIVRVSDECPSEINHKKQVDETW